MHEPAPFRPPARTSTKGFLAFHRDNPQVYRLFERFALEAAESGRTRIGAKMIWERMRWYCKVETTEQSPRLNNNYTSRYARLFIENHPERADLFCTRRHR